MICSRHPGQRTLDSVPGRCSSCEREDHVAWKIKNNLDPHYVSFDGGFQLEWNYGSDYFAIQFTRSGVTYFCTLDGVDSEGAEVCEAFVAFMEKRE